MIKKIVLGAIILGSLPLQAPARVAPSPSKVAELTALFNQQKPIDENHWHGWLKFYLYDQKFAPAVIQEFLTPTKNQGLNEFLLKALKESFISVLLELQAPSFSPLSSQLTAEESTIYWNLYNGFDFFFHQPCQFLNNLFGAIANAKAKAQYFVNQNGKQQGFDLAPLLPNFVRGFATNILTRAKTLPELLLLLSCLTENWLALFAEPQNQNIGDFRSQFKLFLTQNLAALELQLQQRFSALAFSTNFKARLEVLELALELPTKPDLLAAVLDKTCQLCSNPILVNGTTATHPDFYCHESCFAQAILSGADLPSPEDESFLIPGTGKKAGCPFCRRVDGHPERKVLVDPHGLRRKAQEERRARLHQLRQQHRQRTRSRTKLNQSAEGLDSFVPLLPTTKPSFFLPPPTSLEENQ